jgi:hypothetical protein
MKNVTYLFGAGASKNALPIVNELPDKLYEFIETLRNNIFITDFSKIERYPGIDLKDPKTKYQIQQEFYASLDWLLAECRKHASIDTFAKKLWLKKQYKDLAKLKCIFSIFFIWEQASKPADSRYDSFFASIINELDTLPSNINILSWNYDYQFEKSFFEYNETSSLNEIRSLLNIDLKKAIDWPPNGRKFSIVKLNGSALPYTFLSSDKRLDLSESLTSSFLEKLLSSYASFLKLFEDKMHEFEAVQTYPLSFAWENRMIPIGYPQKEINITEVAREIAKETEILVVIGYSFPFFNRKIDREIIWSMSKLKKVYFQAPDAQNLKESFQSIRSDIDNENLVALFDVKQFYLPKEL